VTVFLFDGPEKAPLTVVFAHGAGAPMDSEFMAAVASGLGVRGFRVARFEFPYMAARRAKGWRRPPDRLPVLLAAWREAVADLAAGRVALAGKSMGGRIASMVADDVGAAGLVCLGYPFRPKGRVSPERVAHLGQIATPTLILQGERDPFGGRAETAEIPLSGAVRVGWIPDGDHDFKPRRASGRTLRDNLDLAVDLAAGFLDGLR
jgi:predicted alpha/beta-hydrolase family hydrolase